MVVAFAVPKAGRPKKLVRELAVPDLLGFGFLAAFFASSLVDRVVRETGRVEQRSRLLPSRFRAVELSRHVHEMLRKWNG